MFANLKSFTKDSLWTEMCLTGWKVSKYGVFFWSVFSRILATYLSVFSLNLGKCGSEKTPYLDTFHTLFFQKIPGLWITKICAYLFLLITFTYGGVLQFVFSIFNFFLRIKSIKNISSYKRTELTCKKMYF